MDKSDPSEETFATVSELDGITTQSRPPPSHFGRYIIDERLGKGASGIVYSAFDPQLERSIAIKILKPTTHPDDNQRFLSEARAAAALSHPNVITVYDADRIEGFSFITMELITEGTLRDWLNTQSRSWEEVVDAFIQAGRGLAASHGAQLVHRDFKPENVLHSGGDRFLVTDFGIATSTSRLEVSTKLVGTRGYLAPELFEGQPATPKSDQYAFAVALFEALTTRKWRPDAPEWPRNIKIPRGLKKTVLRALSADPESRWSSMQSLVDQLRFVRQGRNREVYILTALAVVLAIPVGVLTDRSSNRFESCAVPATVQGTWTPSIRNKTLEKLRSSDARMSSEFLETLSQALDQYAQTWSNQYRISCVEFQKKEISSHLHDRMRACFSSRRKSLGAILRTLRQPTNTSPQNILNLVWKLPSPADCTNKDELLDPRMYPRDPRERKSVERVREQLTELQIDWRMGKTKEAQRRLETVQQDARTIGFEPLIAEVQLEMARITSVLKGRESTLDLLIEAGRRAALADHETLQAEVLSRLYPMTADDTRKILRAQADAYIEKSNQPWLSGRLFHADGGRAYNRGRYRDAERLWGEAARLYQQNRATTFLAHASLLNVAVAKIRNGDLSTARTQLHELAQKRIQYFGPKNLTVLFLMYNIASLDVLTGRFREALVTFESIRDAYAESIGLDSPNARRTLDALLMVRWHLEQTMAAKDALEARVRVMFEKPDRDTYPMVVLGGTLAQAELTHGRPDAASSILQRVIDLGAKGDAPEPSLQNIDLWGAHFMQIEADLARNRRSEARSRLQKLVALLSETSEPLLYERALLDTAVGRMAKADGRLMEAQAAFASSLRRFEEFVVPQSPRVAGLRMQWARTLLDEVPPRAEEVVQAMEIVLEALGSKNLPPCDESHARMIRAQARRYLDEPSSLIEREEAEARALAKAHTCHLILSSNTP